MNNLSFHKIGELCATFACSNVSENVPVKISDSQTVSACAAGDDFCGVISALASDKAACSVQIRGFVTVPFSGSAPAPGYASLAADGNGGVQSGSGHSRLVVDVDTTRKTVTFLL